MRLDDRPNGPSSYDLGPFFGGTKWDGLGRSLEARAARKAFAHVPQSVLREEFASIQTPKTTLVTVTQK